MILDATAGNRVLWNCKNPPFTVFIDREIRLAVPPHVFADNRYCPFRDDVFTLVIYDPPYCIGRSESWMFFNPDLKKYSKLRRDKRPFGHYGLYRSKRELFVNLFHASREFLRISQRLCFKWGTPTFSLWMVLPFFKPWLEIYRKGRKSKGNSRKSFTWWVTFVRP